LSTLAVQAHEREETVRLSVFRFAVREAGNPKEWVKVFYRLHVPLYEETQLSFEETWEHRQDEMIAVINERAAQLEED
jgi:hypothetical protein